MNRCVIWVKGKEYVAAILCHLPQHIYPDIVFDRSLTQDVGRNKCQDSSRQVGGHLNGTYALGHRRKSLIALFKSES